MIEKILPRRLEDLALVQKEIFIKYPEASKEILMAIKDIRSSRLDEEEVDLLLEGVEESITSDATIVDEIKRILGLTTSEDTSNNDDDKNVNTVIIADEPYDVEAEQQEVQEKSQEDVQEEPKEEVKEEPQEDDTTIESPFKVQEEPKEEVQEEPQEEVQRTVMPEDVNIVIKDLDIQKEPIKIKTQEKEPVKVQEEPVKVQEDTDITPFEKAMIDYIVGSLTVSVYRSYKLNSDKEVVRAILKEEGYNV